MGKVKTNAAIKGFSNNIDGFVYYVRNGKSFVRPYVKPSDPKTAKQRRVREAFLAINKTWKQVDGIMRESWMSVGRKTKISGLNAFLGENANLQRSGAPLNLCAGNNGTAPLAGFAAQPGANSGEIQVSFTPVNGGHHLTFFAQKKETETAGGPLTRHDAGAQPESPFIVTGLEPGKTYHIYAVVTDTAYSEAAEVSPSTAAETAAGN
jgi:hypothetical protein